MECSKCNEWYHIGTCAFCIHLLCSFFVLFLCCVSPSMIMEDIVFCFVGSANGDACGHQLHFMIFEPPGHPLLAHLGHNLHKPYMYVLIYC